ncbi:MAG: zinc ribbon domain-containing protein [Acidobacteria bacterium]|nr:zinc ribbon domain-containing protein [Acidobacteriota bacterium]
MANCPSCGHNISDTARFCTRCGAPIMQPGSSSEDVATRRLPSDERPTGLSAGRPTGPAYVPPESPFDSPVTPPPSATPRAASVDLGRWLSEGWQVYRNNAGTFSAAFFVMVLLSLVTLTFLSGPLLAGFYHMVFKSMRGEKPQVGDLFRGLDRFWPAVFAWIIEVALIGALSGPSREYALFSLISLALTPLVNAVFFFVYPLIMEQQKDTVAALEQAGRAVFPRNVLPFWVCGLIFEVIFFIGFLGCGVGFFITAPFILCAMAVAYRDFFGLAGPWSRESWPPMWMDQQR